MKTKDTDNVQKEVNRKIKVLKRKKASTINNDNNQQTNSVKKGSECESNASKNVGIKNHTKPQARHTHTNQELIKERHPKQDDIKIICNQCDFVVKKGYQ